ncbi:MAG: hypothetical protein DME26_07680 [Verrucomicrobia bacterium]|nr:MAG: hypothetical protein DME26_07680 [Verrucomicrobiota bacterium]
MSSSPHNFERLLRLLSLKRYEQPPPRYFSEFAGRVIAHLERGGGLQAGPWWRRWVTDWELSPMAACSLGVVACTLLLVGLSYFFWAEPPTTAQIPPADNNPLAAFTPSLTPVGGGANTAIGRPEFVLGGSTNPILRSEPAGFPFGGPNFRPTQVNYIPRNN